MQKWYLARLCDVLRSDATGPEHREFALVDLCWIAEIRRAQGSACPASNTSTNRQGLELRWQNSRKSNANSPGTSIGLACA